MARPPKAPLPVLAGTAPVQLRVSWGDLVANPAITSWSVRHRTAAGPGNTPPAGSWVTTTGLAADTRSHVVVVGAPATTVEITIRAANRDGDGTWSDALSATTQERDTVGILQADLTKLQIGLEGANTAGTLVAASRKVPYVTASYKPTIQRKTLEEHGTVLADTEDIVVSRGSELELTEELNTETIIAALACSLQDASPAGLNGAHRWVFTPAVTAPTGLRTATIEIDATDGVSSAYRGRFGFARATALSIEASSETAQLTTTWTGRAKQALSAAAAVATPARWIIPAQAFTLYVDDSWAALGTTAFGRVRSLTFNADPGLAPAPALEGRPELDTAYWRRGRIRGGLTVVVDHDDPASGELAHWEEGDLRYARLVASNGGSGAALRRLTVDVCMRYIDSPDVIAIADGVHTLDLAGMLRSDGAGNVLRVEVVNGMTTF